jgi:chitinase
MSIRRNAIQALMSVGALMVIGSACFAGPAAKQAKPVRSPLWVTAYYAVWSQSGGILAPNEIDFSAITHLIHFAAEPLPDGSISSDLGGDTITPLQSAEVVAAAHAAHRPVLLCVGGHAASAGFHAAVEDPTARATLEMNLVNMVVLRGYDGLDIDFEPLAAIDIPYFELFVRDMRARLTAAKSGLLMTCAAGNGQPQEYAKLQGLFDQINLMTYDQSGPWIGPHTWYNSNLQNGAGLMLRPGVPYPSVEEHLQRFLDAGVSPSKLSIGTAFYGFVWTGASGPAQDFSGPPPVAVPYRKIIDQYPSLVHWDSQAVAPYLSIDASDPAQQEFISYDDERLITDKVLYARSHGLGGVMIWELGQGYRRDQPAGQRDLLLESVKRACSMPMTKTATADLPKEAVPTAVATMDR